MMQRFVRRAELSDAEMLAGLFAELAGAQNIPQGAAGLQKLTEVLAHPGTCIIGAGEDTRVLSMATLHILPNMTVSGRPYALIENVVTLQAHQGRGFGRAVMGYAQELAWEANAYKIMLLTGRSAAARGFYEKLGYSAGQKWGMVKRRAPERIPGV